MFGRSSQISFDYVTFDVQLYYEIRREKVGGEENLAERYYFPRLVIKIC